MWCKSTKVIARKNGTKGSIITRVIILPKHHKYLDLGKCDNYMQKIVKMTELRRKIYLNVQHTTQKLVLLENWKSYQRLHFEEMEISIISSLWKVVPRFFKNLFSNFSSKYGDLRLKTLCYWPTTISLMQKKRLTP